VIEILDHYGIEISGKRAVVLGRSLVVGKPVSMLLLNRNATVTTCHTKTKDAPAIARSADILVVCTGQMESVGAEYAACAGPDAGSGAGPDEIAGAEPDSAGGENGSSHSAPVIIDVGISWNEAKGKLCGDCRFDELEPLASAITPVPGGVGAVTTSVLVSHVVEAAKRSL